jgi:aryl-alcohol dehydrogenase-like predicted oxidoreductase
MQYGTMGSQYGEVDDEEERRAVERAIDLGVTFFDTAAVHGDGQSEEVLGRALGSRRSDIVLVTKGGISWDEVGGRLTRTALVNGLEDSLRRPGTNYVGPPGCD